MSLAALTACIDPALELTYRFPPGRLTYRWQVVATTVLDSPGERGSKTIQLDMDVLVLTGEANEAVTPVTMQLQPKKLREDGIEVSIPPATEVTFQVDSTGRIKGLEGVAHIPPSIAQTLELDRLLSELWPPLPPTRVELGEAWSAPLIVEAERTTIRLTGEGKIERFVTDGGRTLARIVYLRSGIARTRQQVGRAEVALPGTARIQTKLDLDLDLGMVVETTSTSSFRFDLSVGGGQAGEISLEIAARSRLVN